MSAHRISLAGGMHTSDTIAAIASAPGSAPRGIIRISGPNLSRVLNELFLTHSGEPLHPQSARRYTGWVRFPRADLTRPVEIPAALYFWPTSRSYTGQPLAELHLPGSGPLLNLVLNRLYQEHVRPAEPGEFTLRAFLSGRIDLVRAEAVLGVIDAHGPRELTTALSQLAGGISSKMAELREQLLLHLADLEAGLDFVEEDIEFVQWPELKRRLAHAEELLTEMLDQASLRMTIVGSRTVVLAGLPNAGKSTLLNRLVGQDRAIVSPVAGTTRDFVSDICQLAGLEITVIDTAGWEDGGQTIESLVKLQREQQLQRADLILWCTPGNLTPQERVDNQRQLQALRQESVPVVEVHTKLDLEFPGDWRGKQSCIAISALTGEGLDRLRSELVTQLTQQHEIRGELISSTASRCQLSLERAAQAARRAQEAAEHRAGDEIIACELREVLDHLGLILGTVYTDDILDRIFSRFCIGK